MRMIVPRILGVVGSARRPTGMTRATGEERATGARRRGSLPFAWTLLTVVWLLFPLGFVARVLRAGLPPGELLVFLVSMTGLVGVFLLLALRYPFPDADVSSRGIQTRVVLLLVLAAFALYVELAYSGGVPYRLMYVVIAAAVTLPTREAAWTVAAVTVCAGAVNAGREGWGEILTSWENVVPFPLVGIGMIVVGRLVSTVRELRAAREEIARLAVSEERLRFARDLHDLLGHSLSSITLKSELAGRLMPTAPNRAAEEVRDIEGLARRSLREVREAVAGYRQPTLDGELAGAREMLAAAGIACRVERATGDLPSRTDAALAWAVREGVTNAIRHSRAEHCEIHVTRDGDVVGVEVNDDGRGLEPQNGAPTGNGLRGLSERVAATGGDLEVGPASGGGFRLRVGLPLGEDEEPAAEAGGRGGRR